MICSSVLIGLMKLGYIYIYPNFIGYHLPRRHRSSRGVKRKKQNLHSFIVASFSAQSVKGNDVAGKRCEISTFIKDNLNLDN